MRIPDLISPVVAWRLWQWDAGGLRSLNGEAWIPGRSLRAGCRVSASGSPVRRTHAARLSHDAPEFKCTCGIYASKTLDHLRRTQFWRYGSVHGEVILWGAVVEHEAGFRAEFGYPKTLHLPSETLPVTLKQIEIRIQSLIRYGCDLSIYHDNRTIPLWSTQSGFDAAGLDFLLSRGQEWYARRKQRRTLKLGDQIAVVGRGIAVVDGLNGGQVQASLWNRNMLRIRRNGIVWDEPNQRWEVPSSTASTVG